MPLLMTLKDLEAQLAECRELGAAGDAPVYLECSVMTGIVRVSLITRARHAALCEPASMGGEQIVRIWGVPEREQ